MRNFVFLALILLLFVPFAQADERVTVLVSTDMSGADYSWINSSLNINWIEPTIQETWTVQATFRTGEDGLTVGPLVERLDFTSSPWTVGDSVLLRDGRMWRYGVGLNYELIPQGLVRPFIGGSVGALSLVRSYQETSAVDGTTINAYSKDREWGAFGRLTGGTNLHISRAILSVGVEYYRYDQLPRLRFGAGFSF